MALCGCLPLSSAHNNEVRDVPKTVEEAFKEAAQGKEYLTAADLRTFFENFQGDASFTDAQAEAMITTDKELSHSSRHSSNRSSKHHSNQNARVDLAGFTKLLLNSKLNGPLKQRQTMHDMTAPLSHYYVHTSHNTYLTGNQLWSRSSTSPIIAALASGCRVIELDCWDRGGKIKVLHGGTVTKPVDFEDCIVAIKEHAFEASPYPVIITIENHLGPELQVEAAKILKRILGDELFIPTMEQREPMKFLSPEELKGKIVISDKPYLQPVEEQIAEDPEGAHHILTGGDRSPDLNPKSSRRALTGGFKIINIKHFQKGAKAYDKAAPNPEVIKVQEFQELLYIYCEKTSEMQEKQEKGGPLLSGAKAIMANLSESQLKTFIKTNPHSIVEYTKNNFGRVYPFGLRFDSSNADPMFSWSHGCQLAALNLQGCDRAAWLGYGFFLSNGGCGYVKKPQVFLHDSLSFDEILKLPPKLNLKVKILLGTDWHRKFDYFKDPDFYVRVAVKGIRSDILRKQTKVAFSNKEPNWEDEEFEFPLRVPEIAVLRFEVWENDNIKPDEFVGQSCMPVSEILQGIRVVPLRSRRGGHLSSKLLCQFKLEDLPVEDL